MSMLDYSQGDSLAQASGLGYAAAIAAVVGGLAEAGASIYQTSELSKLTKGQQKINRAALQVDAELRRRELELIAEKGKRESLASQARSVLTSRSAQVGLAAVALLGVVWIVAGRRRG